MCMTCQSLRPWDEDCPFEPSKPLAATHAETIETGSRPATSDQMDVGDVYQGNINYNGDHDYVQVYLEAGQRYKVDIVGYGSLDTYLRVRNSADTILAEDDDGGAGTNSQMIFTATSSAYYYLDVGAYGDASSGAYDLTISQSGQSSSDKPTYSNEQIADYLVSGYWGGDSEVQYFNTSVISYNVTGLTADGQRLARAALDLWSQSTALTFVETSGNSAKITFEDNGSGAYAITEFGSNRNVITGATVNVSADWVGRYGANYDSYTFQTYIHEIGHALGLGHAGPYNNDADYGQDNVYANDSWQATIMSYFSQTQNSEINASYAYVVAPTAADVLAVQQHYGPNTSVHAGDSIYGFGANTGDIIETLFGYMTGESSANANLYDGNVVSLTILDSGGTDTIDLSGVSANQNLSLVAESFSDVFGAIGNLSIGAGVVIENGITGAGDDMLWGNAAANFLSGQAGHDTIHGGAGNDHLRGNAGDDVLNGQGDSDRLFGGIGSDTLDGGADYDALFGQSGGDRLLGDSGDDFLFGQSGNDVLEGGAGFDLLLGGSGNDALSGGADRDTLRGDSGDDTLSGDGGDDLLFGGTGDDILSGGAGNDEFQFASNMGEDDITDFALGSESIRFDATLWSMIDTEAEYLNRASLFDGDTYVSFDDHGNLRVIGVTDVDALYDAMGLI